MENPRLRELQENPGVLRVLAVLLILAILTSVGLLWATWNLRGSAGEMVEGETASVGQETTTSTEPEQAVTEPVAEATEESATPIAPTLDAVSVSTSMVGDTIALSGTGTPGTEIAILANGETIGTAPVRDTGKWLYPTTFEEAGEYELQAASLDNDGAVATLSDSLAISVDESAMPPTLDLAGLEGAMAGEEVTLTGSGSPGSELEILANGEVIGTTTVGDDGTWSFAWPAGEAGDYDLQVRGVAPDGSELLSSLTPFALALPALALPSFNLPDFDLSNLFAGDEVDLSGTGEPGSEVEIVSNGEVVGTTTVGNDGTWSFAWPAGEAGDYDLQVRTLAADGTPVNESEPFSLSISAPDIALPTFSLPGFELGSLFAGDEAELSGTGEPGSEVEIVVDGEVVDTVTVAEDGTWRYQQLFTDPGDYEIGVRTLGADGAVVNESEPFSLSISAPDIALPTFSLPGFELGSLFAGDEAELSGTGEPGSEVEIVVDGEVVDTVTVAEDGTWRYSRPFTDPGDYEIVVRTLAADGAVVNESEPLAFSVAEAETVSPTLEALTVTDYVTDETINLSGVGTPGGEVEIIADGQRFGVAPVKADGTWVFAIAFSDPGDYEVFAQTVDAEGNVLETTEAAAVTVTVSEPSASEQFGFIFPADEGQIIIGFLTLIGTSTAGDEIEILDGDTVLGTTETAANGEWSFHTEPDLGEHQYSARIVGGTGETAPLHLTVTPAGEVDCDSNLGISRGDNYIVGTCNTFGTAIERTGATLESLIATNPQIENPDLIYPGDILNIPQP